MHKKILISGLVFSLFFLPFTTFAFSRDLKVGTVSQDVRQLQVILNSDPATQIASSGIGSPGQESTRFGALTKAAVIRFQIKNGISPTGFVGALTRSRLNSAGTLAPLATVTDFPSSFALKIPSNSLAASKPSGSVTFSDISDPSQSAAVAVHIKSPVIAQNKPNAPVVDSINPSVVTSINQTITVTGSNFSNDTSIFTYFGSVSHLASPDGKTLAFKLSDLSNQPLLQTMYAKKTPGLNFAMPFVVSTSAGVSGSSQSFVVQ